MAALADRLPAWRRGRATRPRPRHRLAWVGIGAWACYCVAQLALAYGDARRGVQQGESARHAITTLDFDATGAGPRMDQARASFDRAHRRSSSLVLAPLRVVPVLGRQLRSFIDLTGAAASVAAVATTTAEAVDAIPRAARPTGTERVSMLRSLADRAARADVALAQVTLGPRQGLVAPLRRGRAVLEDELASTRATLRTAADGLAGVATVLEGPRRYLLLAANNAEMRAGSGMFLSIGTIRTAGGSVTMGPLRPAGELTLPEPGVKVDGPLGAHWGWLHPGREWRNLATTPRFDVTAPLAAEMWKALTGEEVDGVLAVDVASLAVILGATGPVTVGDSVVSETTVVDRLLHEQYRGLDVHDSQTPRREELGQIAAAVVGALETGDFSPTRLAAGLARTSRGRHVLAWSAHPGDQQIWTRTGVAGSLGPRSLAVNVLNRGGNKLDPFLAIQGRLDLRPVPDATEVTVRLKVANRTPEGESSYVAGPYPGSGAGEGDYLGIVAVNLPGAATGIALHGARQLLADGADGPTQVVAGSLLLSRGQETTVTVQFRLPGMERSIEVVPSARVPPIDWETGRHRWSDDAPRVVRWRWE